MVEVDGSDGGGQVLRTALTLSMLTGETVGLTGVRGNRPEPGLGHQHLTAVETAARVCDADVEGAELGATEITFDPGAPAGGSYQADIGTAGSVTLLFDVFLPVATQLDGPLSLTATGGTDVKWSPPLAYYRRVKLPLLRAHGLAATVEPERTGFYPAGGGRATLRLWPSSSAALELGVRGDDETDGTDTVADDTDGDDNPGAAVYSKASRDLADADVAERQTDAAERELADCGVETVHREVTYVETESPGTAVVIALEDERATAGFDAYGEPGKPAEDVAADAVDDFRDFQGTGAAVDTHLADQLLVVLALAGGHVAIPRVTAHVEASLPVFAAFGYELSVDEGRSPPVVERR